MYRRADVERVLRIKQLLYGDGLTLAGVRRKLIEEQPVGGGPDPALASIAELFGKDARERIRERQAWPSRAVGHALRAPGAPAEAGDGDFHLRVDDARKPKSRSAVAVKKRK